MSMSDKKPTDSFAEIARKLECDENEDRFNATLKKIALSKVDKPAPAPKGQAGNERK